MGFKVSIDAKESIQLGVESVETVEFETSTPNDSNARSTDLGLGLTITGKILVAAAGSSFNDTLKLANWSLVPAEDATCYGNVVVDVISSNMVVRRITMNCVYVVSYEENFADSTGIGTFKLVLRQKKDMNPSVQYQGGFAN